MNIPFNKPHLTGREFQYIKDAISTGKISGNGIYTQKCQGFFEKRYSFKKALLTTSCTDALEMTALLMDIKPGDEVIVASYTFVSSALAFVRQGAKIIFADSRLDHPGLNENNIEVLITTETKAIVVVHYAGIACDMDKIMHLAEKYNLFVVEDAAQSIDSFYNGKPLGGIGHFGCFSFHETKNIQCGEGGLLVINDKRFLKRSEIIWEKGTNRAEFFRGEIDKYGWVDIGSSFLPSEITAAFLWAQLEDLTLIQNKRKLIWHYYYENLLEWSYKNYIHLPFIPDYATNNGHIFYIICDSMKQRDYLIRRLKEKGILTVFHYQSLHRSKYYLETHEQQELLNSDSYSEKLLRLPLFFDLNKNDQNSVINTIKSSIS